MTEWTIHVVSPNEATRDEDALLRFDESVRNDVDAIGAATALNQKAGALSATFQVEAPNREEAAFKACLAYWRGLHAAGVDVDEVTSLEVSPADDDVFAELGQQVERFVARLSLEREAEPA